jgi:hypothetical protein
MIYIIIAKDNSEKKNLSIREDKISGIYVDGINEFIVQNVYDCLNLLKRGEKHRKIGMTRSNIMSSRSHTIFMLSIQNDKFDKNGFLKKAKLHLCDLAGSEKYHKEDSHKSMHFNEMVNINLSLGTLGKVIKSLSQKSKHIPYRDSKLTRLLQDSLGGNTRTHLIATVSPSE